MTEHPIATLPASGLKGLEVHPAGAVALRRDLYLFVDFVRNNGLKRAHRGNGIPKGPALKLAKVLSWAGESEQIERGGEGDWSDFVSRLARHLGLVTFDVEGVYAGYSSSETSFPDNHVAIVEKRLAAWLASSPLDKERAILDKLAETTPSEFFRSPTLFEREQRFSSHGCATGPHNRLNLPGVRKRLLELLAGLPAGEWLPMEGLVRYVKATARTAILSPELRHRPLAEWELRDKKSGKKIADPVDDLYQNFPDDPKEHGRQGPRSLTEQTPDGFERVEGRYLQYFLQEVPYLCGFVDLALTKGQKYSYDAPLPLERVRAFRIAPRLAQVVGGDKALNRVSVTVLADFEVIVEAPSWPDRELDSVGRFCVPLREEWPTHTLRIDRKRVLAWAASQHSAPPIGPILAGLVGRPLPGNVAAELEAWSGHADKLTVLEGVTLIELLGPDADAVRAELGKLLLPEAPKGFAVTYESDRAIAVLEQRQRVPRVIDHSPTSFAAGDGRLCAPVRVPRPPAAPKRRPASFSVEDMVACRSDDPKLLKALYDALVGSGHGEGTVAGEGFVLVRGSNLPHARAALRRLGDRFELTETR